IGRDYELDQLTELKRAINSKEIQGVYLEGYYKREYPYNTLASDVIGVYDQAGTANYGVEQEYDDYLTGIYGRLYGYVDNGVFVKQEEILAENGYNVNLTIDFTIQNQVEDALQAYMETHEAKSANAIVMDPQTGEILAMASYPTFDLNDPYNLELVLSEEQLSNMTGEDIQNHRYNLWRNFNVSNTFEQGSTYKSLVLAAALEEGVIDVDTTFRCDGSLHIAGYDIRCWKREGHGDLTAAEALVNSCNVSFMQIGALLGSDTFFNYSQLYGVGEKTGIDMVAEEGDSTAIYFQREQLGESELATSSFGQGFNMTSIQLITAFSSIINGGYMYQPHIMASIEDDSGHNVENFEPIVIRQVISKETSDIMRGLLQRVVEEGTGTGAYIEGYHIGGKTGTAEQGNREIDNYAVSFIGYAEQEEAEVVVLVAIYEPENGADGEDPSSKLAVGVFENIMQGILPYMGLFKDDEVLSEELESTDTAN
ncbi:MAG: penicillin-binding transpeptidase domain-containing protein, partial [Vallitaleaceae bacterium]|nr:penicillin-binding transpeptidase domain-containing protein [Vallitaleaceae bacterium]